MKTFKERLNLNWSSTSALEKLLTDFFDDKEQFKTISHLYSFLNTDFVDIEKRKAVNNTYRQLLETAENMCEEWVVDHGFGNDRSFARWYLDRYHKKETADESSSAEIRIFVDSRSE